MPALKRQTCPFIRSISFLPIFRLHAPFFFYYPTAPNYHPKSTQPGPFSPPKQRPFSMLLSTLITFSTFLSLSTSTLIIDYSAPSPILDLGECQLEGSFLHDRIPCPGNSSIYIKPGADATGKPALHYHRDPTFRRAEVEGKGPYAANKHYYVGYKFSLGNVHEHLTIFQW